jgi:hypothetical protein
MSVKPSSGGCGNSGRYIAVNHCQGFNPEQQPQGMGHITPTGKIVGGMYAGGPVHFEGLCVHLEGNCLSIYRYYD